MITQEGNGKALRIAKIFQIVCMVAVILFADTLYRNDVISVISQDIGIGPHTLRIVNIAMIILAILSLISGYFNYKVILKAKTVNPLLKNKNIFPFLSNINSVERIALSAHIILVVMYPAVAIFGLLLGMLGDGWQITLPFFVVSVILLVITFPKKKGWNKILEKLGEAPHGQ